MKRKNVVLCDLALSHHIADTCFRVALTEGKAPEWIELIPAGDKVVARDGRVFSNSDPQSIVDEFNADSKLDVVIDYEHATEVKAPNGEEAPAAGWVTAMEVRDGSVWGKVEWTQRGYDSLSTREYRYISPAFIFEEKSGKALKIVSVGLTNRPALELTELARNKEGKTMDKELLELLGLSEGATQEEVNAAVAANKAKIADFEAAAQTAADEKTALETELATANSECDAAKTALAAIEKDGGNVDAAKFVPRSEHETALASIKRLEDAAAKRDAEALQEKAALTVDSAIKEGKIPPAARDYHIATCTQEGGLERFNQMIAGAPVILDGKPTVTPKAPELSTVVLSAEDLEVCHQMNMDPEKFKEARLAELKRKQA